ncbi:MAG: sugar-binding protein, partial [Anaerolineaceae bacterium]|nr:sugar-binding protein [Anaerolineaceae bacterium]
MGKKKFLLILVIAVMMTTVITGCTTPATEPTEEATAGDGLSFYFLLKTLSNPHWVAMKEGI